MNTYGSPKEALFDAGRIKAIGRGRISSDNHAWLESEISAGRIAISNVQVVKSVDKPVAVKSVNTPNVKEISEFTILWHKDDYHALSADNKRFGMAEVCNNCRVSLVQCHCGDPTILGDIHVKILSNH